jgi:hypothetical protein
MDLYVESLTIRRAVFGADSETREIATSLKTWDIHYMKENKTKLLRALP